MHSVLALEQEVEELRRRRRRRGTPGVHQEQGEPS